MGRWKVIRDGLLGRASDYASWGRPGTSRYRALSLREYRREVRGIERPSPLQVQAFAEFVAEAHSWYKHLPLFPPGASIQFYLDPAAGMQLQKEADGTFSVAPRDKPGFHYSWLATAEYRERFGHLAFSRSEGTQVALMKIPGKLQIGADDQSAIYCRRGNTLRGLPPEVLVAGRAYISGVVHGLGSDDRLWRSRVTSNFPWPTESGGERTAREIRARCEALRSGAAEREPLSFEEAHERGRYSMTQVDYLFAQLIEPERLRQIRGMVIAMHQVLDLVQK